MDSIDSQKHLVFDGLKDPVALINCDHLIDHLTVVFPSWRPQIFPATELPAILTLSYENSIYSLDADWLPEPIHRKDKVDAICALIAELVQAYVNGNAELLCLHAGAVKLTDRLVVFPSRYRAGKSVLSACLVAAGIPLYCDDVLPIDINSGTGIAPGIAPRIRIPLADNLDSESVNFINARSGLEGKQYLYLDLDIELLAERGQAAPIGAFVLLEREVGVKASLEHISEAEVLHQVIWQNFAREAEAPRILQKLSDLVARAQRFRLRYDKAEAAVAILKAKFADWPANVDGDSPNMQTSDSSLDLLVDAPAGSYLREVGVGITSVGGESFLADVNGAAIHHLNPVGSAIWNLLAEPVTITEMVELVSIAFPGVSRDQIEIDVGDLIDTLESRNLVVRKDAG